MEEVKEKMVKRRGRREGARGSAAERRGGENKMFCLSLSTNKVAAERKEALVRGRGRATHDTSDNTTTEGREPNKKGAGL